MNKGCDQGGIDKAFKTLNPKGSRETGRELVGAQEVQSVLPEKRGAPQLHGITQSCRRGESRGGPGGQRWGEPAGRGGGPPPGEQEGRTGRMLGERHRLRGSSGPRFRSGRHGSVAPHVGIEEGPAPQFRPPLSASAVATPPRTCPISAFTRGLRAQASLSECRGLGSPTCETGSRCRED